MDALLKKGLERKDNLSDSEEEYESCEDEEEVAHKIDDFEMNERAGTEPNKLPDFDEEQKVDIQFENVDKESEGTEFEKGNAVLDDMSNLGS
jgi:hypothetical protein